MRYRFQVRARELSTTGRRRLGARIGRSGAVPGTARGAWMGLAGAPEPAEVRMVATRVVAGPRQTGPTV